MRHIFPPLLLLLGACTGSGASDMEGDFALEIDQPGSVTTVKTVSWAAPGQGSSWVEYGIDGDLDQASPVYSGDADWAEIELLGLKAGETYSLVGVTETADGTRYESKVVELELAARPEGLPGYTLVVNDEDMVQAGGVMLFTVMQADHGWIAMVDRDGDFVWWHDAGDGVIVPTVELGADGRSVLYTSYDVEQTADIGALHRVDLRTGVDTQTRTELAHHDFAELPDGQVAWLAYSTEERFVDGHSELYTGDAVVIGPEGMTEENRSSAVRVFDLNEVTTPTVRCQHASDVLPGTEGLDWSHGNSLMYQEDDDSFIVNFRHLDTFVKMDAVTGEVLWSLGDLDLGNPMVGPDHPLDHAHFSDVWDGGLLAFDNSDHRDDSTSRLVELIFDEDAGTYDEVWSYTDPDGAHVQVLGDARRLPDGGVLSSWASMGSVREIAEGNVVWRLDSDLGGAVGRVRWVADLYDMQPEVAPGTDWSVR